MQAVVKCDEGGAFGQRALVEALQKDRWRKRVQSRGNEIEHAAKLARRNKEILRDPAQHRRPDVVEGQDEALVFADEAAGGQAGRKGPECGSEQRFEMWANRHKEVATGRRPSRET